MGILRQSWTALHQTSVMFPAVTAPSALLLDAYPNAAFAYSQTRKLRAAYSGSSDRIRRSGDDLEADIGFSGNNFNTAGAGTHIAGGSGSGFVGRLYDQSAVAGTEASQATAANQPAYTSSPLGLFFDANSAMFMGASLPSPDFTVVASIQAPNGASSRSIIGGGGGAFQWRVDSDEKLTVNKRGAVLIGTSTNPLTVDTPQMVAFTYDGTNWAHYLEGAANGSGSNLQTPVHSGLVIGDGAGEPFTFCYLMELIAWPSIFSAGDIAALKAGYY